MDRNTIEKILEAGVRAPSGENSQPWRFVMSGDMLSIYNLPDRDRSLYNIDQLGSFVAHGALIENIMIAASAFQYAAEPTFFPSQTDENHVANITFKKEDGVSADPLMDVIPKRVSNRTHYNGAATFSEDERKALLGVANEFSYGGKIKLIEDKTQKEHIAKALSYGDRLLFESDKIHDFLFGHIYWSTKEAEEHKSGFYVKELGLAGPQEATFKLLRSHGFLHFFRAIGFPKIAAQGNVKLYANVSGIAIFTMPGNTKVDFLKGGSMVQRFWLTANRLGYDVQPISAILFFEQRILRNEAQDFSAKQVDTINASHAAIKEIAGIGGDTMVFLMRVGKGKPLAWQSLRLPPDITYT